MGAAFAVDAERKSAQALDPVDQALLDEPIQSAIDL